MIILLFLLGMFGGVMIPFQTSINNKLSLYTRSALYTSTISFGVGLLFLLILNAFINPHMLTLNFLSEQSYHYYWFTGGLIGVVFLTGNLLLLPRLGASLTVIISLSGQLVMGVVIDTFGWFDAEVQPFSLYTIFGIALLFIGINLMNDVSKIGEKKINLSFYFWLIGGFFIGFGPPIQTAINSKLGQAVGSSFLAALVSFTIGFITLFIMKFIESRKFNLSKKSAQNESLKAFYFIGGALGAVYITANIVLMPYLGAALTTLAGMLGQMIIAIFIDHFGLLGIERRSVSYRKFIGIVVIVTGIILLRFL